MIRDRILFHLDDGSREPLDPQDVYLLRADGDDTLVRLRHATPLRDVRELGQLEPLLHPHGFARINRSTLVNLRRVQRIRPAQEGEAWEVVMEPPVNRVLPVSRRRSAELLARFGPPEDEA
jgi:DNA-binding LytR/AlgR family response regulator